MVNTPTVLINVYLIDVLRGPLHNSNRNTNNIPTLTQHIHTNTLSANKSTHTYYHTTVTLAYEQLLKDTTTKWTNYIFEKGQKKLLRTAGYKNKTDLL